MSLFETFARYVPGPTAAWGWLIAAGCAEVGWAVALKYSNGFTRVQPTVIMIIFLVLSFPLLALALKSLPVSTGYAVWTSIGIAGTAFVGIFILNEPISAAKIVCLCFIMAGVLGLKLTEVL